MIKDIFQFTTVAAAGLALGFAAWATETTIGQKDSTFSKEEVTLKAGDTIKFLNDDTVAHNVSVSGPTGKKSHATQKPGESTTVAFDAAGAYEVRCLIHPKMKMAVTAQ